MVLQLFNREAKSRQEFDGVNREHMDAYKDAILAYGWFYPVVEFLSMLALAGILAYGGFRIERGALTLGVLVAFLQYGLRFFRPIQDLSEKYNILQGAMASAERIFKLLDTERGDPAAARSRSRRRPSARIEFDDVWFAYKDEDWVLRDVSFTIEPGETIAVVGHTGAGKTTLISLLLRFYDVQKGAIRVGGIDVRDLDPQDLRRQFGVVLQDPYLFTGTLEDNIRLGTEGISREAVEEAAEQVNLLDFIRLPARRLRAPHPRARQRPFHRPEAADQLRARAGAQSALPDSGRSHFQRRYRDRVSRARGAEPHGGGPHVDRHRAPPIHHPARRPHPGDAQRPAAGDRHAPAVAGAARHLLEAVSVAV